MGVMTREDIEIMKRQRGADFRAMDKEIWTRAFADYNTDHEKDRPLGLHCRSCYIKVYNYLKLKYAAVLNN